MNIRDETALTIGRCFFGLGVLGSGILQLVIRDFVRVVPKLPAWVPAPSLWAVAIGVVLVLAGLSILSEERARPGAAVVGAFLLVMLVLLCLPELVVSPGLPRPYLRGFMWTKPLKVLALLGGAVLLAQRLPAGKDSHAALVRWMARLGPCGAAFFAAFLVVGGIQHFVYLDFVTELVPAFMPERRFWAQFAGVALIAGGVGMLIPRTARLAATLSGVMIFLWVLMLHIPRSLSLPEHAFETAGIFEALALSGVAFTVAATRKAR